MSNDSRCKWCAGRIFVRLTDHRWRHERDEAIGCRDLLGNKRKAEPA